MIFIKGARKVSVRIPPPPYEALSVNTFGFRVCTVPGFFLNVKRSVRGTHGSHSENQMMSFSGKRTGKENVLSSLKGRLLFIPLVLHESHTSFCFCFSSSILKHSLFC